MPAPLLPDLRGALERGEVAQAARIIGTVVAARSAPPWIIANSILAVCDALGPDAAAELAAVARATMPGAAALLLLESEIAARRGALDGAIALARDAASAPDQRGMGGGRASLLLARHLVAAGDQRAALSVLEALLRDRPDTGPALAMASTIQESLGNFAQAAALAGLQARLLRSNATAWLRAIRLLLRAGDPESAVAATTEAHAAIGPNPHVARERAGALHGCGRFAEAAAAAAEGLDATPGVFALHRQRVLSLIAARHLEEAAEAALAMVRATAINAEVTFTVNLLLQALPDAEARAAFLGRAVAANPHPRIRAMQAGAKAADPAVRVEARDRRAFATEIFPPDDLVPILAGLFAGTPYAAARQLQTWTANRLKHGARPAPITAYTVQDAKVFIRDGLFVIHDADGVAVDLFAQRPSAGLVAEAAAAPVTGRLGPVFLVNSMGMRNYAHWCLDMLPQIAVADTHFPGVPVVVPELEERRFMRQTLAVYGVGAAGMTGLAPGRYRVDAVTLLSASVTPTFRHALQFGNRAYSRNLLDRSQAGDGPARRRLYIDRPPSQRRTVVNREAFIAMLEPHGFETIDPGTLGVAQQAATFAEASHVVGLHGAALANLMHCRPGTRVLEIHSPDHTTTAFAITALVRDCDYRPHIGQSIATDGRLWAHPQDMDFRIDPDALAKDLEWLLR